MMPKRLRDMTAAEAAQGIAGAAKRNPKTTVTLGAVAGLVAMLWGGGENLLGVAEWFAKADIAHAQTTVNQTAQEQNAEAIKELIRLETEKLERKKAADEAVAVQCRAKEIKNRTTCARVGVILP